MPMKETLGPVARRIIFDPIDGFAFTNTLYIISPMNITSADINIALGTED